MIRERLLGCSSGVITIQDCLAEELRRLEPDEVYGCDLVAISTFSAQVFEAYAIADRLRARRRFHAEKLFHGQDITQVVGHRRQVIHAVGHDQRLRIGLGLHGFLDAGM